MDFGYLPTDRYHSTFHLHEDTTHMLLADVLEIHFVELPKLHAQTVGIDRRLARWMLFLTTSTHDGLEALAMDDPSMRKALTALEFLSQDKRTRELYEARQKALLTYTTDIEGAREDGWIKGREEGREKGERTKALAIARNLLQTGMDLADIARVTGLPPTEVPVCAPNNPRLLSLTQGGRPAHPPPPYCRIVGNSMTPLTFEDNLSLFPSRRFDSG